MDHRHPVTEMNLGEVLLAQSVVGVLHYVTECRIKLLAREGEKLGIIWRLWVHGLAILI
jgi:hypothetical protein